MVGAAGYLCYWYAKLGYGRRAVQMGFMAVVIVALFGFSQYFMTQLAEMSEAEASGTASELAAEAGEWQSPLYSRIGFIIMLAAIVIRFATSFYRLFVTARDGRERGVEVRRRLQPVRIALLIIILIGLALVAI